MTTADITKEAIKILDARNVEAWRQNNLATRGYTFKGRKGLADVIGYNRSTGVFNAVEVKNGKDILSDKQHEFLSGVKAAGGFAFVATCNVYGIFELLPYKPTMK